MRQALLASREKIQQLEARLKAAASDHAEAAAAAEAYEAEAQAAVLAALRAGRAADARKRSDGLPLSLSSRRRRPDGAGPVLGRAGAGISGGSDDEDDDGVATPQTSIASTSNSSSTLLERLRRALATKDAVIADLRAECDRLRDEVAALSGELAVYRRVDVYSLTLRKEMRALQQSRANMKVPLPSATMSAASSHSITMSTRPKLAVPQS
jgi:hypothetical protein